MITSGATAHQRNDLQMVKPMKMIATVEMNFMMLSSGSVQTPKITMANGAANNSLINMPLFHTCVFIVNCTLIYAAGGDFL